MTHRSFLGDRIQLTLNGGDKVRLSAAVARNHAARLGNIVGARIQPQQLMPGLELV